MTNRPKGKLFALLAIFAAIGIVTATGAFTSVQAERTVNVQVANDSSALVALEAHNGQNGQYASFTSDGELTLDFTSADLGSAEGVNPNANTTFDKVFNVTNQGSQTVNMTLTSSNSSVLLFEGDNGDSASTQVQDTSLGVSDTMEIGLRINSTGFAEGNFLNTTITVSADAETST